MFPFKSNLFPEESPVFPSNPQKSGIVLPLLGLFSRLQLCVLQQSNELRQIDDPISFAQSQNTMVISGEISIILFGGGEPLKNMIEYTKYLISQNAITCLNNR